MPRIILGSIEKIFTGKKILQGTNVTTEIESHRKCIEERVVELRIGTRSWALLSNSSGDGQCQVGKGTGGSSSQLFLWKTYIHIEG